MKKTMLRFPEDDLYERVAENAAAQGTSLNAWLIRACRIALAVEAAKDMDVEEAVLTTTKVVRKPFPPDLQKMVEAL
jgi:hypothetical protein